MLLRSVRDFRLISSAEYFRTSRHKHMSDNAGENAKKKF